MAGGDSHVILSNAQGFAGAVNAINAVDANSVKSGNMTEPREVTDKTGKTQTLYFTDEGAKLFDKYSSTDPKITVDKDPSGISSLWKGIVKKEEGVGKPN